MWIKLELPNWIISILPRKIMVSVLRRRMIRDFQRLGFTHNNAVKFVDESILESKNKTND